MRDALPPSTLIDARELAAMLNVSLPSIWRWKSDGKLPPAITISSQTIRWRRSDVESWIARGCPPQNNNGSVVVAPEPSANRIPLGSETA